MKVRTKASQAAAAHWHYERNKATMKARAKAYTYGQRARMREMVYAAKARPCMDCGVEYPHWVMDFDHRNPIDKDVDIATGIARGWSEARLLAEMAKCDLVCANCHRNRTHQQRISGAFQKATPSDADGFPDGATPMHGDGFANPSLDEPIWQPLFNEADF